MHWGFFRGWCSGKGNQNTTSHSTQLPFVLSAQPEQSAVWTNESPSLSTMCSRVKIRRVNEKVCHLNSSQTASTEITHGRRSDTALAQARRAKRQTPICTRHKNQVVRKTHVLTMREIWRDIDRQLLTGPLAFRTKLLKENFSRERLAPSVAHSRRHRPPTNLLSQRERLRGNGTEVDSTDLRELTVQHRMSKSPSKMSRVTWM